MIVQGVPKISKIRKEILLEPKRNNSRVEFHLPSEFVVFVVQDRWQNLWMRLVVICPLSSLFAWGWVPFLP